MPALTSTGLTDARTFLTRVWPANGADEWLNIASRTCADRWFDDSYGSIAGVLAAIERLKPTRDVYACMSIQMVRGKRAGKDARALRSLWLDVDVKEGYHATTEEAFAALDAFIRAAGLPPPTLIVLSGSGGFHCHWTLDRALPVAEWRPLARALSNATLELGFNVDRNVITNAAQLLRIPGTYNFKRRPERFPVLLHRERFADDDIDVSVMAAALAAHMKPGARASTLVGGNGATTGARTRRLSPKEQEHRERTLAALDANPVSKKVTWKEIELDEPDRPPPDPRNIDQVATRCPAIADALKTGGKGHREPLWHILLMAASFCADPEGTALRLSKGHADFDEDATLEKLSKVQRARENNPDLGYPSCAVVKERGADPWCKGCKHDGKLRADGSGYSPLNIPEANPRPLPPAAPFASASDIELAIIKAKATDAYRLGRLASRERALERLRQFCLTVTDAGMRRELAKTVAAVLAKDGWHFTMIYDAGTVLGLRKPDAFSLAQWAIRKHPNAGDRV